MKGYGKNAIPFSAFIVKGKRKQMEEKMFYEVNLPQYLQDDLDAMKKGSAPYDCLWGELYGSINSAFVDGDITEEHAWYLREKYLNIKKEEA